MYRIEYFKLIDLYIGTCDACHKFNFPEIYIIPSRRNASNYATDCNRFLCHLAIMLSSFKKGVAQPYLNPKHMLYKFSENDSKDQISELVMKYEDA
jgi:hypothetical protein